MSNLDLLFERAKTEGVSADELLGRLLDLDRQFWRAMIAEGEESLKRDGEVTLEEAKARLQKIRSQADQSA